MKPTYPSVPPIDGNVPVLLSWDSKKERTLVWYGKKTMRKSFQFDEHDELTAETVEAQVRKHHMFAAVLAAHSPTDQSSAAAASDAATLEASIRQEEAREAAMISETYIMYEDRPNTRSDAERRAPDRFEATETLRDRATGERRKLLSLQEAKGAEPNLAAQLEKLIAAVREATVSDDGDSDQVASGLTRVEDAMERTAATTVAGALMELLAAAPLEAEQAHIWGEGEPSSSPLVTVSARFDGAEGSLSFVPPMLKFSPDQTALGECGGCDFQWPLASFVGVYDDEEERERCELRLLQGEDDGLLVGFKDAVDLVRFERTLRVAAASARAAECTPAAPPAALAPAAAPAEAPLAAASKRQKTETARVRRGRQLRDALKKVASLLSHDKSKQAKEALAELEKGPQSKTSLEKSRAGELRDLLFTFGGFNLTKAALDRFLSMGEVRRLLDDDLVKTRQEMIDATTATAMLQAAKRFFNEMLKSQGRRTDVERNAFWAGVVALMPSDMKENRQMRAIMRILQLPYRTIKQAKTMRKELEDKGVGWVLLETKPHSDSAAPHIKIIQGWWHAVCPPDNQNKEKIRVYEGHGCDQLTGRRGYELHQRLVQEGSDKELLKQWRASPEAAEFRRLTATRKRPNGIEVGRKMLVKYRCVCIKKRSASQCDCKICSHVEENLRRWHSVRGSWRRSAPECTCPICSDPALKAQYLEASRSTRQLRLALLPCGETPFPNYSLPGTTFTAFNGLCCKGRCPKRPILSQGRCKEACGWQNVFGADCPVEASDASFTWNRWEQRLRGENEEGKKFYSDEWVPHTGTRREFIAECACPPLRGRHSPRFVEIHRDSSRFVEIRRDSPRFAAIECRRDEREWPRVAEIAVNRAEPRLEHAATYYSIPYQAPRHGRGGRQPVALPHVPPQDDPPCHQAARGVQGRRDCHRMVRLRCAA